MKSARINKPLEIEIVETDTPQIDAGQMLIQSKTVSLCGSDLPLFLNGRPAQYPLAPGYPGHECIGVVVQSRCEEYKEGDEVLAIPAGGCGFAEYFVSHPVVTVRLPAGGMENKLVVAQPLGTVIHSCKRLFQPLRNTLNREAQLDVKSWKLPHTKVAIVGQGAIGLFFTAMMRMMQAETIIGIDLMDYRLDVSQETGATHVVNAANSNPAEMVMEITNGTMADIVIEAVGKSSTINDCFRLVRHNGTVIAFGVPESSEYRLNFTEFFRKEVKLLGTVGPQVQIDFPPAVELVANEGIDVSQIITHIMPFDKIQQAFEMAANKTKGAIKILLEM